MLYHERIRILKYFYNVSINCFKNYSTIVSVVRNLNILQNNENNYYYLLSTSVLTLKKRIKHFYFLGLGCCFYKFVVSFSIGLQIRCNF